MFDDLLNTDLETIGERLEMHAALIRAAGLQKQALSLDEIQALASRLGTGYLDKLKNLDPATLAATGAGVGGLYGLAAESRRDPRDRNYMNALTPAMLLGGLGGGVGLTSQLLGADGKVPPAAAATSGKVPTPPKKIGPDQRSAARNAGVDLKDPEARRAFYTDKLQDEGSPIVGPTAYAAVAGDSGGVLGQAEQGLERLTGTELGAGTYGGALGSTALYAKRQAGPWASAVISPEQFSDTAGKGLAAANAAHAAPGSPGAAPVLDNRGKPISPTAASRVLKSRPSSTPSQAVTPGGSGPVAQHVARSAPQPTAAKQGVGTAAKARAQDAKRVLHGQGGGAGFFSSRKHLLGRLASGANTVGNRGVTGKELRDLYRLGRGRRGILAGVRDYALPTLGGFVFDQAVGNSE